MSIELGVRVLDRLLRRALDLVSELDERGALSFALRLQSFRVCREPFLGLLDQSSLAAGERLELVEQLRLRALEILAPRSEALLDPALRLGKRIVQLVRRRLLALGDHRAPRLGDAALLVGDQGD